MPDQKESGKIEELGRSLEERIGAAMDRGDWDEAQALCAGLAGEYGNAGILTMFKAMLDKAELFVAADQTDRARRVGEAVGARDAALATRLLAEKRERHGAIHERYIAFMAELMDAVVRLWGEEGLERLLRDTGEAARAAMFDPLEGVPMADQIGSWAKSLRNHLGRIEVSEDHEKYTIRQDPCGSGGRLMRAGRFDGESALSRVSAKGLTLGAQALPVYCSHCPVWMVNQHDEWYGRPRWVLSPPESNDSPCVIHLYKDGAAIPEDYRKRLAARQRDVRS